MHCRNFYSGNLAGKVGGFKKVLPSVLFDVIMPTLDVYSDLSLIIPWYIAGHPTYAASMTVPLSLQFTSTIYQWIKIEKPADKKWSWIFLFLQLWPQLRALRIIHLLYKGNDKALHKRKKILADVCTTEPFLEAWPSVLVLTVILFSVFLQLCI